MTTLFVGTGNRKKLDELRRRLDGLDVTIVTPGDLADPPPAPEETTGTFSGNATQKALYYADRTGHITLADDSGLEVDALGGLPGVDSAYYAGHPSDDGANNRKLLESLDGVPLERRTARYRCVLVLAVPGRAVWTADGTCEGRIGLSARGSAGFGYDPLFLVGDGTRTFGELSPDEKDRISHRGKALALLRRDLPSVLRDL